MSENMYSKHEISKDKVISMELISNQMLIHILHSGGHSKQNIKLSKQC